MLESYNIMKICGEAIRYVTINAPPMSRIRPLLCKGISRTVDYMYSTKAVDLLIFTNRPALCKMTFGV